MGFLGNAGNLLNRGVANAGRGAKAVSLKAQIADLDRSRTSLMAQLGESLFEPTKALEEFRSSREALYASIEELDSQRSALQSELESIERQASFVTAPAPSARCSQCGRAVARDDLFCPGCGVCIGESRANSRTCVSCGNALGPDDSFCMGCGTPVAIGGSAEEYLSVVVDSESAAPAEGSAKEKRPVAMPSEPVMSASLKTEEAPLPIAGDKASTSYASADLLPLAQVPASAPVQDDVRICPTCGYRASLNAAFCRNCGLRLLGASVDETSEFQES